MRLLFLQTERRRKERERAGEIENGLEKRTRGRQALTEMKNAEPIGVRSRVRRKIDNVVRRIPNPLHRFFNPICRSFAERIPTESIACEPFAAIRPTSARQRIEKLHRGRERERKRKKKKGSRHRVSLWRAIYLENRATP